MRLTPQEVKHIASLCRIHMDDADIAGLQDQLSNILEQFEVLKKVSTDNIPPTSQALDLHNVFREDASRPSLSKEAVLQNAPHQQDDYLKIRAVIEE